MLVTKSMKRRLQRKAKHSRIREAMTPKPKSIEEIQIMLAQAKDAKLIEQFNAAAPTTVV